MQCTGEHNISDLTILHFGINNLMHLGSLASKLKLLYYEYYYDRVLLCDWLFNATSLFKMN